MYADKQRKKVMERDAQIKLAQGDKLAKRGMWPEAVTLYTESIDLIPTNAMTFFNRAKCYFEMHDYHRYVFDISLSIHIEPSNYVFYVARSHGFYMLKKVQEALKDLDYAISEAGSSADLFFRRGVCYYDLRRWSDAINDFTRCIELNPAHPSAYSRRGAAYLKLKNGTLAIDDLRKSVNVSSRSLQHKNYFKLAIANLIIGDALASVEAFSAALEIARNYRAELISKQKAKASKVAVFGISGAVQKEEEKVDIKRFTMVVEKVRYQLIAFEDNETFNIFDDAISASPPKYTPMAIYTPANRRLEQLSSEKAELEATEKCFPEYLASRGKAKALLGRHSEALQDFSESIAYSPNNAQTYYERSNAFRIMGFYENALQDIEYCAHRKLNADIAYAKAIICENIGELEEALIIYEAILAGIFSKPYTTEYLQSFGDRGQSSIDAIVELSLRGADETMIAAEQLINEERTVKMIELDSYVDDLAERSKRVTNYALKSAGAGAGTGIETAKKQDIHVSTGFLDEAASADSAQDDKGGLATTLINNTSSDAQTQFFGLNQRSTVTANGKVFPKPRFFHLPSLYHAALLYRQKLNFERAVELIRYALSLDPLDDKLYELLAILHYDSLDYQSGITCIEKVIEIQSASPTGVFWESYYLLGMCHMKLQDYSKALECMILAQKQPAGGAKEPLYKQMEIEKINGILASLPPGSNIANAYLSYAGSSAIPRDPLSPTSAARGYRCGKTTDLEKRDTSPNSIIFPLLDLSGALPGCNNLHVLLRKAECLFYLSDYIGCVRSCSLALKEFDFSKYTHRGVRVISNAANLIRSSKPLRQYNLAQVVKTNGNIMSQEEITELSASVEVPLNSSDKEYLFNVYFLRARALAILNRLERSIKDAFRARFVYLNLGTVVNTGTSALLYFMARTYAFLRLYTKSYHCARDAIKAGLPYYAVSRAHYMQGIALMYTNRKELAAKCFSLALKTSFTAKFAGPIFDKLKGEGIIVLPSLEEIAHFVELYKEYDPSDYEHFPKVIENGKKVLQNRSGSRNRMGSNMSGSRINLKGSSDSNSSSRPATGNRLASSSLIETFATQEAREFLENRDPVVYRMPTMQCLPITGTEAEFTNKVSAYHNQRIDSLEKRLKSSKLWTLANQLEINAQNFDEFFILTNRLHQAETEHILRGPLRFATTNSWLTPSNVYYLHERAKCLQELGLHELATDDFTSVLRFQPKNDRAFFRRGFSLRAIGLIDEAALDFEMAKKLRPDISQYHLSYENISNIGYLELVPYGQEEFYDGTHNAGSGRRDADPEGLYDSDTYPPLPDEHYIRTQINNTHHFYVSSQDVFDMVRTFNDSVRLRKNVEKLAIPLNEEDAHILNEDSNDIPPDASVLISSNAEQTA